MQTGFESMDSKSSQRHMQARAHQGVTSTAPKELALQAEMALLRASHREALQLANQCLSSSSFLSHRRSSKTRHNNNQQHALTCPIRWSPLATPRFMTIRSSSGDDTPTERCAAVAWQSWFALSSSSSSIHALEPFWDCFTHSSISSTISDRSQPMSLELLLIVLLLCHQSSPDDESLDWIVPLATEVLCLDVVVNDPSRDELAIRLFCDWLPSSPSTVHVPHMLACVETRCWTLPAAARQWQPSSNSNNHTQEVLELCYQSSVRIPQPWAFTCRARLLEQLTAKDDCARANELETPPQAQQLVKTTTEYYDDYKNRILHLLYIVYTQWRTVLWSSKEGNSFDYTTTVLTKSSVVLGLLLCLLLAYRRRRRHSSVVRAALRRGGALLLQPVREILQALAPS